MQEPRDAQGANLLPRDSTRSGAEGNTPGGDGIGHGAQAEMAPALAPANDAPSESAMTPVTPASDPPPAKDQTQDMEVDDYAARPSLPSPVSHEDDDLLLGPAQSEATEVESGLAHLSVSSPRGPNGEGEEASQLPNRMRRDPLSRPPERTLE